MLTHLDRDNLKVILGLFISGREFCTRTLGGNGGTVSWSSYNTFLHTAVSPTTVTVYFDKKGVMKRS